MGIDIQRNPVGFRSGQKGVTHPERTGKESSVNTIFLHVPSVTFPQCQKAMWLLWLHGGMGDSLCPVPAERGATRSLRPVPGALLCWAHWAYWKLVSGCWKSQSTALYPQTCTVTVTVAVAGDAVYSAVVRMRCVLLPQSFVGFILFFFPGATGVTLQKALPPRGGALQRISIPIRVPCLAIRDWARRSR